MKIKYIKDLTSDELDLYKRSNLYDKVCENYELCDIFLDYNKEYYNNDYKDVSLVAYDANGFYLALYAFTNDYTYSFYGQPVSVTADIHDSKIAALAYKDLYTKLVNDQFDMIYCYHDPYIYSNFYEVDENELNISNWAYIDLDQNYDAIKMNIRKSYKSLINWGYKSLDIKIFDANNADKKVLDSFRDFHIQVSKRRTRSDRTWDLQYQAIEQGLGILIMGYLDTELVCGVYVCISKKQAYYGVAVNNRDLMAENKPLGHALLLEAIHKTKEMGIKQFVLGEVSGSDDVKTSAINRYKRGFTNTIECKVSTKIKLISKI